uniref:TF-B3 domain-containing protein n=1 Tax=Nelumbo nucifera TaxID=4432 RepID=A0A822Z6U7_NELNU|nr:TPA_asm: hypothetical protein HUJ06_014890 [Nelumbo nucifera]
MVKTSKRKISSLERPQFFKIFYPSRSSDKLGFVKHHSLELGDFLVFKYDGNSVFDVKIFGRSGCEKNESLYCKSGCEENEPLDYRKHREPSFVNIKEESDARGRFNKKTQVKETYSERIHEMSGETKYGSTKSKRSSSANAAEDRLIETARFFKPKNPHFTVYVKRSMPYTVIVPKEMVIINLLDIKPHVVLYDLYGKSWPVKVSFWKDGRATFSTGWSAFWRESNLRKNDKCIFEFTGQRGRKGSIVRIYIIRSGLGTSKMDSTKSQDRRSEDDHVGTEQFKAKKQCISSF